MFAAFLITFREGLEAALILGIVLGVLSRLELHHLKRSVWAGLFTALGASLVAALVLLGLGQTLEGRAEEIYEGVTMLTAAALLTWMLFWMGAHARTFTQRLTEKTEKAASMGAWALFMVAFIAVIREGLETALFWVALFFQDPSQVWFLLGGGVLGLLVAILVGVAIFQSTLRLNLRLVFLSTGLLLLFVAAGLIAQGVHELQEAGILPVFVEELWNTSALLAEESTLGLLMSALFGYNATPSLLEVITYWTYIFIAGTTFTRLYRGQRPQRATA